MSPAVRWHIFFSGQVQFVGFRYQACLLAKKLGLTGWVENLGDGRVEMEVREIPPVPGEKKFGVKGYESVY